MISRVTLGVVRDEPESQWMRHRDHLLMSIRVTPGLDMCWNHSCRSVMNLRFCILMILADSWGDALTVRLAAGVTH